MNEEEIEKVSKHFMHGNSGNSKDDLFKKNNSKNSNTSKIDSRLLDPKTKTEINDQKILEAQ